MSKYCFLCLSDEGVFLNITPYNYKSLCGEVESYLPVKIEGIRGRQSKVCYKCAYELKQCSEFVKKYKESRTNVEKKIFKKQCCNLCLEPAKKGYIFKLNKDNDALNNLWSTIEKLFDGNVAEIDKSALICLTCRYILDILFDLTCLCQEMSKLKDKLNEDIDYSKIPKVNTAVIKRKTTATKFMRLKTHVISDSDSDSSINKNQYTTEMNKDSQSKVRLCDQCKNSIKHGEDMYRFHRSGLTVCGTCRGSMDLNTQSKKKNEENKTNTKLCTVFLKDVLTDTTLKKQKAYKVEKDSYGNQVYIITESESEVEGEDKVKVSEGSEKTQGKRSKLKIKNDISENETKKKKKVKVQKQNTIDLTKLRELPLRSSTKRTPARCNHYSDTDILLKKSTPNTGKKGTKRRNITISSVLDISAEDKSNRKKLRSILEHFRPSKDSDISDDTSIIEDSITEKNPNENEKKRKTISSSLSSNNENESSTTKSFKRIKLSKISVQKSKLSKTESSPDADETNADEKEKYICSKCCIIHENKLTAATHELTHFKQLELRLYKINISGKLEDEKEVDGSSEKQLTDELAEQQNEEITLNVNDDEDTEIAVPTEDTNEQSNQETNLPSTENQVEDSQINITNKESTQNTKTTDTITESVHKESTNTNEDEVKTSETTTKNILSPTPAKNENVSPDNVDNDQIQNDNFESDKTENEEKINKIMGDKDKVSENGDIESTESEKIELNLEAIDEDENEENEIVDGTENESVTLPQNNIEGVEDDAINKSKKDEENEDKIEEIEQNKIEITETSKEAQKEQSGDTNIHDDMQDLNDNNVNVNNKINEDEVEKDNLNEEKQKVIENLDNVNDKNDMKEANVNTVDNIALENSIEDSIENNVTTCKIKSPKDNYCSSKGENEEINGSSTSHAEKVNNCMIDTERIANDTENVSSCEPTKNKEIDVEQKEKEATEETTNTITEMAENIFDLATDELDNNQDVMDQNKRYSEMEAETLEDISREIQKSADMPSLEPISSVEVDHKELV